jgi:hypothetical protein
MQIRFESDVPWWVVIGLALLGAMLIGRWYYRESRTAGAPWSWLLPLLRSMSFLLLIAMLAGPILKHEWIEGELSRVSILLDTSQSMSFVDRDQTVSRFESIRSLLLSKSTNTETSALSPESLLGTLASQHHVRVLTTTGDQVWDSQSDQNLERFRSLSPDGKTTPLGEAILQQWKRDTSSASEVNSTGEAKRALADAVVLLTDGQSNTTVSPLDAVASASNKIPIHVIGIGDAIEPNDFAILSADVSQTVRREDRLRGTLRIKEVAPPGTVYQIVVSVQETEIFSKMMIAASRGVFDMEFDAPIATALNAVESTLGQSLEYRSVALDLDCRVESKLAEASLDNNQLQTSTWGIVKQNQVLILDPRGRWEFRYIRNALERDPTWKVQASIGPNTNAEGHFPKQRTELLAYDLVIMASDTAAKLNEEQMMWLVDFVRDSGGGLVWIDSERARPAIASPLLSILPVLSDREKQPTQRSQAAIRDTTLRISSGANSQPAFQLDSSSVANQSIWSNFPPFHSYRTVEVKPGAEVMLESKRPDDVQWQPLIATSLYGQGRVLYLATDETWRWRYGVADLYHQRFWNQISGWVMRSPFVVSGTYISLDAGKRVYSADESVVVRAKVLNESSQPLENGIVQLHVFKNNTPVASYPMQEIEKSGGIYRSVIDLATEPEFLQNTAGEFELRVSVLGIPDASNNVSTSFLIAPHTEIEMQSLACNQELLKNIADKSGGKYYTLDDAKTLSKELEAFRKGRIVKSETVLWQSYPWFVTVMVLLTLEWYLRKRAGFV